MSEDILDKFEYETQQDPRHDIRAKYREVFRSPLGRAVLQDILQQAEFGSVIHPENAVRFIWHNVAVIILREAGMMGPALMDQVVNALCNVFPGE